MLDKNYETDLNTLTTQLEYQIYSTEGVMDPTKIEAIFEQLVDQLDSLYEKSRLLDELYYYTKNKLSQSIETETQHTKKLISFIENNMNSYQKTACFSKSITFSTQSPIKILKDRDGSILLKADISEKITLPYASTEVFIDKIDKTSTQHCYKDNISSINKKNESFYKSFYSLEQPTTITETLMFLFDSPAELNKIDFFSHGADIISAHIETSNEEIIPIDLNQTISDLNSNIKKIVITVVSNKFKKKKLIVDQADFTHNTTFGGVS